MLKSSEVKKPSSCPERDHYLGKESVMNDQNTNKYNNQGGHTERWECRGGTVMLVGTREGFQKAENIYGGA